MSRNQALLTVALALGVVTIGACNSTASLPSAAASVAPASDGAASAEAGVCADAAAVETSLAALKAVDLQTAGKAGVTAAIESVQSSVTTLATSARAEAGPEADALTTAITTLRTTIDGLSSDASVSEKAADIRAAVDGVQTAATALRAKLTACS